MKCPECGEELEVMWSESAACEFDYETQYHNGMQCTIENVVGHCKNCHNDYTWKQKYIPVEEYDFKRFFFG